MVRFIFLWTFQTRYLYRLPFATAGGSSGFGMTLGRRCGYRGICPDGRCGLEYGVPVIHSKRNRGGLTCHGLPNTSTAAIEIHQSAVHWVDGNVVYKGYGVSMYFVYFNGIPTLQTHNELPNTGHLHANIFCLRSMRS